MAENARLHDLELGSLKFSAFLKLFPTLKSNGALQFEGSSWVLRLGAIAKCSHDVTAAILVSENNETAAMLVSQTSPVRVELLSYANAFFCSNEFA